MTTSPTTRSASSQPVTRRARLWAAGAWRPGRREAGFTLVELILVVTIMSALAALVWPQLVRFSRSLAVRAAARDLVGVMGRARLEALSRREPVEVRFGASRVTVVRPQPRTTESDASVAAASASAGGSLTEGSQEVTVLEYPLGKWVAWSRLQVLPEKRDVIPREQEVGLGQSLSPAFSEGEAVTLTFYPDGTSDDALIGLGERQQGGAYGATPASAAAALAASGDVPTDYVVRVRGLVARAMVLRAADESDEDFFAEVPDAVASLAD